MGGVSSFSYFAEVSSLCTFQQFTCFKGSKTAKSNFILRDGRNVSECVQGRKKRDRYVFTQVTPVIQIIPRACMNSITC